MQKLIFDTMNQFIDELRAGKAKVDTDFDNEFGFQFELGIRLRAALIKNRLYQQGYKVYFEKNIKRICEPGDTIKKEIDLCISNENFKDKYAIELKFPRNGQYPEEMFAFIKDIKFLEQLKDLGFEKCWSFVLANDPNFFKRTCREKEESIYEFFRSIDKENNRVDTNDIYGTIQKPTGDKDEIIVLDDTYKVEWTRVTDSLYYYIIEV